MFCSRSCCNPQSDELVYTVVAAKNEKKGLCCQAQVVESPATIFKVGLVYAAQTGPYSLPAQQTGCLLHQLICLLPE